MIRGWIIHTPTRTRTVFEGATNHENGIDVPVYNHPVSLAMGDRGCLQQQPQPQRKQQQH